MPFKIHQQLSDKSGYAKLKDKGDRLLEKHNLNECVIEIRPATSLEERAMAGKGLAPGKHPGDNFVSDTRNLVVYWSTSVENPRLKKVESAPEEAAEDLVERLKQHLADHGLT